MYEIHLGRFAEDLETKIPITKQQWLECVSQIEGLKYIDTPYYCSIEAYSEKYQELRLVLFVGTDGSCFARASGFFESEIAVDKAIEIATYFNAFIYGDDGEIYFLPGYGLIAEGLDLNDIYLNLEDLKRLKPKFGNNYKEIIEEILKEEQDSLLPVGKDFIEKLNHPTHITEQKGSGCLGLIVFILIMIAFFLFYFAIQYSKQS